MKNESQITQDREILFNSLINKYGTYSLNKTQTSRVLNRSIPSLDRDRISSRGPAFKKDAAGNVYYPIHTIVDYLLNTQHTLESQGFHYE